MEVGSRLLVVFRTKFLSTLPTATLASKTRCEKVMEEFDFASGGTGRGRNIGRIVGFREHVFTHDVSAVANFFSLQELNFVSATQRALDNPLHVSRDFRQFGCFFRPACALCRKD